MWLLEHIFDTREVSSGEQSFGVGSAKTR